MPSRSFLCGCICCKGMFLMSKQHGSARISLRHLDAIPSSLSSPPELVSKLLDPWEQQSCCASSRRVTTIVNEVVGEMRSAQKKVVVLGGAPAGSRALGIGEPQYAPRNTTGGRVVSGKSKLVPLEVIKAKAALHVSDWDMDELDENADTGRPHPSHARPRPRLDSNSPHDEEEEGSLLATRRKDEDKSMLPASSRTHSTVHAISLFRKSIAILKQDFVEDAPWVAR